MLLSRNVWGINIYFVAIGIVVNSQKILIDVSGFHSIVRVRMESRDLPATLE